MTLPRYSYAPAFGVEPYEALGSTPADEFGGGARLTQQNLLLSLWNLTAAVPPLTGDLMKPLSAFPADVDATLLAPLGLSAGENASGLLETFDSRTAARFFLLWDAAIASTGFMAVLNAPPAMRERVVGNMEARLDAASPTGYTITFKNGLGNISRGWDIKAALTELFGNAIDTTPTLSGVFGDPLAVPALTLSLLKRSGVDGVSPEFYASPTLGSSPQDIVDDTNALAAGAPFFVPCLFVPENNDDNNLIDISWAHSTARAF